MNLARHSCVLVALALGIAGALSGCRAEAACRERCLSFGLEPQSEQCTLLCTKDCDELEGTFGVNAATCRAMQNGTEVIRAR